MERESKVKASKMTSILFLPRRGRFRSLIGELRKFGLDCSLLPKMRYRNFFALPTSEFVRSINADVFVSSNPYYGLFGASLAKKRGSLKKSVFRLKGDYWSESSLKTGTLKNRMGTCIKKIENALSIGDVDFILAISDWMNRKAALKGLKNIYTLYNGVDVDRFRPREINPEYETNLLCVMNFNIRQKIAKLYDFLDEYEERKLPYRITFLGSGVHLDALKKYTTKIGLDEQVTYRGWVNDIEHHYSSCDVLVHPSGLEAFGMAPLEAGSSSKPVIATEVGGIPEIVIDEKTGLLTNDIGQFVDYVEDLMADENRRERLGKNARLRILANFKWEMIAKRFVEILEREGLIHP
jgi:glycosyltransferase involved in cell wall biosynthesis